MTDNFSKIQTQWGSVARGFGSFSEAELEKFAERISSFCKKITLDTGIPIFLSYGGLLGAVRNGKLIKHDFDIDVIFCSEDGKVPETCYQLTTYLTSYNAKLEIETNGQFKATVQIDNESVKFEFFAGWTSGGKFYQYFAIPGTISADKIFPLSEIMLEGASFPAPRDPVAVVEKIYGSNWVTPDPSFKYDLSSDDWAPFKFLFLSNMKKFWEGYYATPEKQRVFASQPSAFAIEMESVLGAKSVIADFGCGNGRDSIHFAKRGHEVFSVDYSSSAIEYVQRVAEDEGVQLRSETLNVQSIGQVVLFAEKHRSTFDAVYARFFTHAIDDIALKNFFMVANEILRPNAQLHIEFRTRPEGTDEAAYASSLMYENGDHFRRLRSMQEMETLVKQAGFSITQSVVAHGLAVWKQEDPLVGRIKCKKE